MVLNKVMNLIWNFTKHEIKVIGTAKCNEFKLHLAALLRLAFLALLIVPQSTLVRVLIRRWTENKAGCEWRDEPNTGPCNVWGCKINTRTQIEWGQWGVKSLAICRNRLGSTWGEINTKQDLKNDIWLNTETINFIGWQP